jgi:arylsulfatase A-like enzyme
MTSKIKCLQILLVAACFSLCAEAKPNVLFVLADQWRAQATTWENDPNLVGKTPVLDKLAKESVNFKYAVSCTPVCTPYRGCLLTGQYPLKHKLIVNDVSLSSDALSIAEVYAENGYDTAYIGKWHVDGRGRTSYIPRERRQGFDYWKVLECTHEYNNSSYYAQDDATKKVWPEYDAFAQTKDAQTYIAGRKKTDKPFLMILSWGPPHNPYEAAPEAYRKLPQRSCRLLCPYRCLG